MLAGGEEGRAPWESGVCGTVQDLGHAADSHHSCAPLQNTGELRAEAGLAWCGGSRARRRAWRRAKGGEGEKGQVFGDVFKTTQVTTVSK